MWWGNRLVAKIWRIDLARGRCERNALVDVTDGTVIPVPLVSAQWTPDGNGLVGVTLSRPQAQLVMTDVEGRVRRSLGHGVLPLDRNAVSPDGSQLVGTLPSASSDGPVAAVLDLRSGEVVGTLTAPTSGIPSVLGWYGEAVVWLSEAVAGRYDLQAAPTRGAPANTIATLPFRSEAFSPTSVLLARWWTAGP